MFDLDTEKSQVVHVEFYSNDRNSLTSLMANAFHKASKRPLPQWTEWGLTLLPIYETLIKTRSIELDHPNIDMMNEKHVFIGFSGGKDSTAVAIKVKKFGGDPTLVRIRGLNRAYSSDEERAVLALSKELGLETLTINAEIKGTSDYIENPIKNQLILAIMVDAYKRLYGEDHGLFVQGNQRTDTIRKFDISCGYSDCIEMYEAARYVFKSQRNNMSFFDLLEDDFDSFTTIYKFKPTILESIQSCMSPIRYRQQFREQNIRKYGVKLLPNRCGSCYKCAIEWLNLMLMNEADYGWNEGFIKHCVNKMVVGLQRTYGKVVSIDETIDEFMPPFFKETLIRNGLLCYSTMKS